MFKFSLSKKCSTEKLPASNLAPICDVFKTSEAEEDDFDFLDLNKKRAPTSWFKEEKPISPEDAKEAEASGISENSTNTVQNEQLVKKIKQNLDVEKAGTGHKLEAGLVSLGRFETNVPKQETNLKSQHIAKLMKVATQREIELEIIRARKLNKEKKPEEEVFVTKAYQKKLQERKEFEEKLEREALEEKFSDPKLKSNITDFYYYMVNSGLAGRSNFDESSVKQFLLANKQKSTEKQKE